ncbi:hypothetical protein F4777DRAFT_598087 [Nemania sp. FL0916]|nr:hypothetical protein F4777DRAFT_598087 [Nemania sp. FL0916]
MIPLGLVGSAVGVFQDLPLVGNKLDVTHVPVVGSVLIGIQAAQSTMAMMRAVEAEEDESRKAAAAMEGFAEHAAITMTGALPPSEKQRIQKAAEAAFYELIPQDVESRIRSSSPSTNDGQESGSRRAYGAPAGLSDGQMVDRKAAAKAFTGVPTNADNAGKPMLSKAVGVEDLVGSLSAAIMGSAHHEVSMGRADSTAGLRVSAVSKRPDMPPSAAPF